MEGLGRVRAHSPGVAAVRALHAAAGGEAQARELLQEATGMLEKSDSAPKRAKALRRLKGAAEAGLVPAQSRLGRELLAEAELEDGRGQAPISPELVPELDALGRPTGGAKTAQELKREILFIRNKNKGRQPKDHRGQGIKWLLRAAEGGDGDAMVLLGTAFLSHDKHREAMQRQGIDLAKAVGFLAAAADLDPPHPDALYNLALLSFEGFEGVWERDPERGVQLMTQAADELSDASAHLWLGQFLDDPHESARHIRAAADLGLARAQVYAALEAAERGERGEAVALLDRALAQEDAEALYLCADLHMQEEGTWYSDGRDYAKALRLYERAGIAGHGDAWVCAGAMHYNGLGTPKNDLEAYRAYSQGAQCGSLQAYRNIAGMHFLGEGPLKRDEATAREILRAVERIEADRAAEEADQKA